MPCGAIQNSVAAFFAFIIDYYFLTVANGVHFLVADWAEQRSFSWFHKILPMGCRYNFYCKNPVCKNNKKEKG